MVLQVLIFGIVILCVSTPIAMDHNNTINKRIYYGQEVPLTDRGKYQGGCVSF